MPRIVLNYNEIGARIRAARKAKKMSQKKLAEMVGCHHKSIWGYEIGKVCPPLEVLLNCCVALDIKLDKLITIYYEQGDSK